MSDYILLIKCIDELSGKLSEIYDVCLQYGHTSVTESILAILGCDIKEGAWDDENSDGRSKRDE